MARVVFLCVLALVLSIISGIIISQDTTYQVVTYNNEILNVHGYELYGSAMRVVHNDETILIKSYRRVE